MPPRRGAPSFPKNRVRHPTRSPITLRVMTTILSPLRGETRRSGSLRTTKRPPVPRLLSALLALVLLGTASGEEPKGPLANLPSKPGAHVEKIKALGDNEWLNLGPPTADPKWGKARGRS